MSWFPLVMAMAVVAGPECPVQVYTDRGMTEKDYTTHDDVKSADDCCALCGSLVNSSDTPCLAWTYHQSQKKCETAPYATVVFGADKISGQFTAPPTPAPPPPKPPLGFQPNIVLVLQDDQDIYMSGWRPMRQATELVSKRGATATNWFIHTPVCCPSRGELLSGRYFHNIREPDSKSGCMHIDENKVNPINYAKYLTEEGYTSGYFGKYLNDCPASPPPGFDCETCYYFAYNGDTASGHNCTNWLPNGKGCSRGGYVNSALFDFYGGKPTNTGGRYNPVPGIYQADSEGEHAGYIASVVNNKTIEWIRTVSKLDKPWIATVGNRAPHAPFTPAPWYAEGNEASAWIDDLIAPRTPDYNASCPNFHWLIAHQDPITEEQANNTDDVFRNRYRALMSVDDGIAGISNVIDELGLENKTYILITSDHGWNLGQHRLPGGKHNVYDHSARIPFVIRGPGIKPDSMFDFPANNADVAPTMLGLAGIERAPEMDGRSIVPLIVDPSDENVAESTRRHIKVASAAPKPWRTFTPIEFAGLNNHTWFGHLVDDVVSNTYRAMRFVGDPTYGDLLYAEFTAVTDWHYENPVHYELFNMTEDPHQLKNLYYDAPADLINGLQSRLVKQWGCAADTCP